MQPTKYDPSSIKFEQTECLMCLNDYSKEDSVVKLPCEHIFHEHCFQHTGYVKCPSCLQHITAIDHTYSKQEQEEVVSGLANKLFGFFPDSPRLDERIIAKLDNNLPREDNLTQNIHIVFKNLSEISADLDIIEKADLNSIEAKELIKKHTPLINECLSYYNRLYPATIRSTEMLDSEWCLDFVDDLKRFVGENSINQEQSIKLFGYLTRLAQSVSNSPSASKLFQSRTHQYIKLTEEAIQRTRMPTVRYYMDNLIIPNQKQERVLRVLKNSKSIMKHEAADNKQEQLSYIIKLVAIVSFAFFIYSKFLNIKQT